MFIAFIFTISLDYKKARKMDYYLLNAYVVLAQDLAHSEACTFWSLVCPREVVGLSQEFSSLRSVTWKSVYYKRTQNLYAVEQNCSRS